VLLYDLLPSHALAELIGIQVDEIFVALSDLHSLVPLSENDRTFRIRHRSFLDFISDLDRCKQGPQFHINRNAHHLRIAKCSYTAWTTSSNRTFATSSLTSGKRTESTYSIAFGAGYHLTLHMRACTWLLICRHA